MPDVDGIELLRHVRQDDSLGSVPVVSKLFSLFSSML
jgi:CheY-like chemotaxis protein